MNDEQIEYHAKKFFNEIIMYIKEDSEFEIEKDLRSYQYKNRKELYKGDPVERNLILDYLRKNNLVEFKERRIITDYYQLGQYGKDIINGKERLFY